MGQGPGAMSRTPSACSITQARLCLELLHRRSLGPSIPCWPLPAERDLPVGLRRGPASSFRQLGSRLASYRACRGRERLSSLCFIPRQIRAFQTRTPSRLVAQPRGVETHGMRTPQRREAGQTGAELRRGALEAGMGGRRSTRCRPPTGLRRSIRTGPTGAATTELRRRTSTSRRRRLRILGNGVWVANEGRRCSVVRAPVIFTSTLRRLHVGIKRAQISLTDASLSGPLQAHRPRRSTHLRRRLPRVRMKHTGHDANA